VFRDPGKSAQVMMFLHQLAKTLLFKWKNNQDKDFGQVKPRYSPLMKCNPGDGILQFKAPVHPFL
jgi:hypothetical protein